jgi:hypothetical protein
MGIKPCEQRRSGKTRKNNGLGFGRGRSADPFSLGLLGKQLAVDGWICAESERIRVSKAPKWRKLNSGGQGQNEPGRAVPGCCLAKLAGAGGRAALGCPSENHVSGTNGWSIRVVEETDLALRASEKSRRS